MGAKPAPSTAGRVALYLRVSTGRQADSDLSIPDQRRQLAAYALSKGWTIASEFSEPGSSATDDKRPAFQAMIDEGMTKPAPFSVILVHSFSRFFRDQFLFEFYTRKLARNGVRLVSITQELGDDPMGLMMRQIMALFDEYQSRENAKHTLRAMKENARQGFWNGSRPPLGYCVVDAELRGAKMKRKLAIDPVHAETVRLIFDLALMGKDNSGPMGVKAIACHLNDRSIRTRDGGRWGISGVHQTLTRETYKGEHHFNSRVFKTGEAKDASEHIVSSVPPIVSTEAFDAVRLLMAGRNPRSERGRFSGSPILLGGICFCGLCGCAMTADRQERRLSLLYLRLSGAVRPDGVRRHHRADGRGRRGGHRSSGESTARTASAGGDDDQHHRPPKRVGRAEAQARRRSSQTRHRSRSAAAPALRSDRGGPGQSIRSAVEGPNR